MMVAEGEFRCHGMQREAVAKLLASHFGQRVEIAHTETGAPFIPGFEGHISISHCATAVAVAVSDAPVGIDVESHRYERMRGIARRFISPDTLVNDIDSATMLPAIWCAKEAVYKLHCGKVFRTHTGVPFPPEKHIIKIAHTTKYTLAVATAPKWEQ